MKSSSSSSKVLSGLVGRGRGFVSVSKTYTIFDICPHCPSFLIKELRAWVENGCTPSDESVDVDGMEVVSIGGESR